MKLAVDHQIKHREVSDATSIWSFVRIDRVCLGRSGGFGPVSLPFFQGVCLRIVGIAVSRSCMSRSSGRETEEHDSLAKALELGAPQITANLAPAAHDSVTHFRYRLFA